MTKTVLRVLWMAVWVTVAAAAALKIDTVLPGHEFFQTLPEYEQPDYLSFELSRGYTEEASVMERSRLITEGIVFPDALDIAEDLVLKFKSLEVPKNFTKNLFNFVRTEFDLDHESIRTLIIARHICFENGHCIDLNDVGAICCPF